MTAIQRRACRSLKDVAYGRHIGDRAFGRAMARKASRNDWQLIELTAKQLSRVARQVRRYRRQISSPNLLFWAQRVLVELQQRSPEGRARDLFQEVPS